MFRLNKVFLQMKKTMFGSMQAARAFWPELRKVFRAMLYTRSKSDPCLYFRWDEDKNICIWLMWINNCIAIGKEEVVAREYLKLMSLFHCDDVGPMQE
jgi:hypothetical protein